MLRGGDHEREREREGDDDDDDDDDAWETDPDFVFGGEDAGGSPLRGGVHARWGRLFATDASALRPAERHAAALATLAAPGGTPGTVSSGARGAMLLVGGSRLGQDRVRLVFDSVWRLAFGAGRGPVWERLEPEPASAAPVVAAAAERWGHSMLALVDDATANPAAASVFVYAGRAGTEHAPTNDLFVLEVPRAEGASAVRARAVKQQHGTVPGPRAFHAVAADTAGRRMFVVGGSAEDDPGAVYCLSCTAAAWTWHRLDRRPGAATAAATAAPANRREASLCFRAADESLLLFGGISTDTPARRFVEPVLWRFDIRAGTWDKVAVREAVHELGTTVARRVGPRAGHVAFLLRDSVLAVVGGTTLTEHMPHGGGTTFAGPNCRDPQCLNILLVDLAAPVPAWEWTQGEGALPAGSNYAAGAQHATGAADAFIFGGETEFHRFDGTSDVVALEMSI